MVKLDILFDTITRPKLTELVIERARDILDSWDYTFFLLKGRAPENPCDEIIDVVKKNIDVKWIMSMAPHEHRGRFFNAALDKSTGDYVLFLENDFYWVEDRLEQTMRALEEVDFIMMETTPFHNFTEIHEDYYLLGSDCRFGYNFGPSLRKEKFIVGRYDEELHSAELESWSSDTFNAMKKRAAVLPVDSFKHVGLVDSKGKLRLQHFTRENIDQTLMDAAKWARGFMTSSHADMFVEHLQTELTSSDFNAGTI